MDIKIENEWIIRDLLMIPSSFIFVDYITRPNRRDFVSIHILGMR